MTETRYFCDHCGRSISEARSQLRAESGPVRLQFRAIDLCQGCATQFMSWLSQGKARPDEIPADVDPPDGYPPVLGRSATAADLSGFNRS